MLRMAHGILANNQVDDWKGPWDASMGKIINKRLLIALWRIEAFTYLVYWSLGILMFGGIGDGIYSCNHVSQALHYIATTLNYSLKALTS